MRLSEPELAKFTVNSQQYLDFRERGGLGEGESTRLPPMWCGFDFLIPRLMWVKFIVSLLCSKRFFPGYSGLPLSPKNRHLI